MRRRLPLVLATLAALMWAPSLASAAGNGLGAPSVSPATGSITTPFTLEVAYDGRFPAVAVSASVAGMTLPMARISGTSLAGTWSVTTLLPAGTWATSFAAVAERGNTSAVTGPTVTVSGPALPPATPVPTGSAGPPSRGSEPDPGPGSTQGPGSVDPGTAPVESPSDPGSSGESAPSTPSPASSPAATSGAGSQPSGDSLPHGVPAGTPDPAGAGDDGSGPDPAPNGTTGARPSEKAAVTPASSGPADGKNSAGWAEDESVSFAVLIGVAGMAGVAILGAMLLVLGRRRAAEGGAPSAAVEASAAEALLERRTVRQAKVRLPADPIVAAMGIDERAAARRRRRAGRLTQESQDPTGAEG